MLKHIDEKDFDKEIKKGVIIVDFYASWCGPCMMLAPELEELSDRNPDVNILKIDVDKNLEVARKYNIDVIPTLLFFKDGKLLKREQGFYRADDLEYMLEKIGK